MKQEKLKARIAVLYTFITNVDYLVILPLLPLFVAGDGGVSATKVATVLSLRVGASLIGSLASPILFAKRSYGFALFTAAVFKALAFGLLFFKNYEVLLLFSILTGLGTGFLKPAIRSVLASSVHGELRKKYFQYFFIAMNLAFVVGPPLSKALEASGLYTEVFILLIIAELFGGALTYIYSKDLRDEGPAKKCPKSIGAFFGINDFKSCFRGSLPAIYGMEFINYLAMGMMVSAFVLYDQIHPSFGDDRFFFLSFEGLALITCQFLLVPAFKKYSSQTLLAFAPILYALGIVGSFLPSFSLILIGLTLFALGECLALPQTQILASNKASSNNRQSIFSMITVFSILGEIAGNVLAGVAIDSKIGQSHPSIVFATIGIAIGLLFFFMQFKLRKQCTQNLVLSTDP